MKFLDKIAINRLISILTNFVLFLIKIFKPSDSVNTPTPRRRPLLDLINKWTKK